MNGSKREHAGHPQQRHAAGIGVRSLVHNLGTGSGFTIPDLPGKPDLVFPSRQKVIFVHGCFWHSHECKIAHVPKSNQGYWGPKLERNKVARSARMSKTLKANGWKVLVIWECKTRNERRLSGQVRGFLER